MFKEDTPPAMPDFDLMRYTPYRLAVAAQKLSEALERQYKRRFGISIPEWRVIVHVTHWGGASVRDIEARVGMEKSKVSRAASKLEKKGFITKQTNEEDRRLIHLTLTPKGQRLMAELLPLAREFQENVAKQMGVHMAGLEAGLDVIIEEINL